MQKSGRLIVSIKGTTLTALERTMLQHPMIAGLILFSDNYTVPANFQDKTQLRDLIIDITKSADTTCFVDQEGGFVQRFGRGFRALPSAAVLGEIYDLNPELAKQLAYKYGAIMAGQLMEYGIISLAPVCDLDGGNAVISRLDRAFHKQPKACTELLSAYIDGMNSQGMQATGKHFPGHGFSFGDTHLDKVVDDRSLAELEEQDLYVFKQLISANQLAAIMPAHIIYKQIDPDNLAGSSQIWLQDMLRTKYGYQGIIISDDLSMVGAGEGTLLDKAEQTLDFCDILILSHQDPETVIELCEQLSKRGHQLSAVAQQRYNVWTSAADVARHKFVQTQTELA